VKSPRRLWFSAGGAVLCLAAAAGFAYHRYGRVAAAGEFPTASAKKGEFLVIVSCRGELVAGKSVQAAAPLNVPNMQIVWMVPAGSHAGEGDIIVRFDPSAAKRQLQEKEAALKQAQATLEQAEAQARIQQRQDQLEADTLGTNVERARIEASKAEIVSVLQAEEARVELRVSQQKLKVQEAAAGLNKASAASRIASLTSQRNKAQAEVDVTRRRIEQMEVKAPASGIVSYLMNFSQGWVNAKPFAVGDQVWPGSVIAEIPDVNTLEMKARVEEVDRGRLSEGQDVRVVLDPFPEKPFPGRLRSVAALTEITFGWPPQRNFRAYASFRELDGRLRPGMNGRLDVIVDRLPDAISVPAKAVQARDGKPHVFVPSRDGLRPVPVEIVARNPDEVAVRGIEAGTQVVLVDAAALKKGN